MARGRIEVQDGPAPKQPMTLDEHIRKAREDYLARVPEIIDVVVKETLEGGFDELVLRELNLQRDHWSGGYKFYHYSPTPFSDQLDGMVRDAAKRIIDSIDFDALVLTKGQLDEIKRAYLSGLKDHLKQAARDLAEHDAEEVVAQVLGSARVTYDPDVYEDPAE